MLFHGLILILTVICVVLDTTLSGSGAGPRFTLALLAWLALSMRPRPAVWVWACVIGMIHDAADPGSWVFHGLFALFACALCRLARQWLFPTALFSVALMAAIVVVVEGLVSSLLVNQGGLRLGDLLTAALFTALLSLLIAWPMRPWVRRQQW